jgi:hypothetical protein
LEVVILLDPALPGKDLSFNNTAAKLFTIHNKLFSHVFTNAGSEVLHLIAGEPRTAGDQ